VLGEVIALIAKQRCTLERRICRLMTIPEIRRLTPISGAVGDVMKGYLGQKPTILVHQGSNVSIRVDSDLEFY
jgi:hypothetical protein